MLYLKIIIVSIIESFFNLIPLSNIDHTYLYQQLFNTTIFDNQSYLFYTYLALCISIIIYYFQDLQKICKNYFFKSKRKNKNSKPPLIKYFFYFIIINLPTILRLIIKPKYSIAKLIRNFLITTIFLFIASLKKGSKKTKDLSYKNIFSLTFLNLFTIIFNFPYIPIIFSYLIIANFKIDSSLKITFLLSLPYLITQGLLNYQAITYSYFFIIPLTIFISIFILRHLTCHLTNSKLFKLAIYSLIITIATIIWFR